MGKAHMPRYQLGDLMLITAILAIGFGVFPPEVAVAFALIVVATSAYLANYSPVKVTLVHLLAYVVYVLSFLSLFINGHRRRRR